MSLHIRQLDSELSRELGRVVVGAQASIRALIIALLARGHVLVQGVPGLGKTLLAKSLAHALGGEFKRIQGTPDLMPSDIIGVHVFDERERNFVFRPGPLFADVVLVDEINRAGPKTQSALLEAMEERQVSVERSVFALPADFMVLATQNPIEYEGTYPLPEAQLDRFLIRTGVGYPSREHEIELLARRLDRGEDEVELTPVVDAPTLVEMQHALEHVHVADSIEGYIVDLVAATRASRRLAVGASPRGSLALLKLSRAKAALAGRDFVVPEDVKAVAVPALAHRLTLRPELWVQRVRGEDVVEEALAAVPTPPAEDALRTAAG